MKYYVFINSSEQIVAFQKYFTTNGCLYVLEKNADPTGLETTLQNHSEETSLYLEHTLEIDSSIDDLGSSLQDVQEIESPETRKEELETLKEELRSLKEMVVHLRIQETKVYLLEEEIVSLKEEVSRLRTQSIENDLLQEETKKLKTENERLEKKNLSFQNIVYNNELCYHYTGLRGDVVCLLRDLLEKIYETHNINSVKVLNSSDQLLLTLIRLRRNLSYKDIAFRFGVAVTTVQTVFSTTLSVLHEILFRQFMDVVPSREKNNMFIPECFKSYPNVRIVLDCTEIPCDIPKAMAKQKATYSNYKGRNTIKYQVGCAVNGCITHCSSGYPGSTSDKAIVKHSGILSQLVAGDVVLADKGFLVNDLLPPGVSLNIPSFLNDSGFTEDKIFENRSKSRARIHIERINSRIKRFLICTHIPHKLFSSCDIIVQTCCALVNLQNPVMNECTEFFKALGNK